MKRDMDFVREILLGIEELCTGSEGCEFGDLLKYMRKKGYGDDGLEDILYGHCEIMDQGGLIVFSVRPVFGGWTLQRPIKLLWAGHEFLDDVRDQGAWKEVKNKIGNKMGSISFEVVKIAAAEVAKGYIG